MILKSAKERSWNKVEELRKELEQRSLTLVGGDFLDDSSIYEMCRTIDEIANLLQNFSEAKYIVLLPSMYTDLETLCWSKFKV